MWDSLVTDARAALRGCTRFPEQIAAAVIALALGVAVNGTVLAVVERLLLHPPPYPAPERLVAVWDAGSQDPPETLRAKQFEWWKAHTRVVQAMGAYGSTAAILDVDGDAERIQGCLVSDDTFRLLGVAARIGREIGGRSSDGDARDLVIAESLWRRRFAGNPNVVGRTVSLDGTLHRLVGVMPEHFYFPSREEEFWVLMPRDETGTVAWSFPVIARLRHAVTPEQASAEGQMVLGSEAFAGRPARVAVQPLMEHRVRNVKPVLRAFQLVGAAVLAIAIVNAASALRTRSVRRLHMRAIEVSLGADTTRLLRVELLELACVGVAAGALGLTLAHGALRAIALLGPRVLADLGDLALDASVIVVSAGLALAAALLAGLWSTWRVVRVATYGAIGKSSAVGPSSTSRRLRRLDLGTLAGQVALACAVLPQALLLCWIVTKLVYTDMGTQNSREVAMLRVSLPNGRFPTADVQRGFYDRVLRAFDDLEAAGVRVGIANILPLTEQNTRTSVREAGIPIAEARNPMAAFRIVSPGYFPVMGISLLQGRLLTEDDDRGADRVAVLSDNLARVLFGDSPPLGRQITLAMRQWEIVGVMKPTRLSPFADPQLEVVVSYKQLAGANAIDHRMLKMWVLARPAGGGSAGLAATMRDRVPRLEPDAVTSDVGTMGRRFFEAIGERVFYATVGLGLALLGLVLTAVGTYASFSRCVWERRQEIAIRTSLGASRRRLLGDVFGSVSLAAGLGMVCGMFLGWGLGKLVSTRLPDAVAVSTSTAVLASMATIGVLVSTALLASLVPARRMMRIDPAALLRQE